MSLTQYEQVRMTGSKIRNTNYFILAGFMTAAMVFLLVVPKEWLFSGHPFCLHYYLFGVQCPLCGSTRGLYSLLHGNFTRAWALNFNVFLLAVLYLLVIIRAFSNRRWVNLSIRSLLWVMAAGYVILYINRLI